MMLSGFTADEKEMVVQCALHEARQAVERLPGTLAPEHVEMLVSDVAVAMLEKTVGITEIDGKLVLIRRANDSEATY